jgi:hypothetical protein
LRFLFFSISSPGNSPRFEKMLFITSLLQALVVATTVSALPANSVNTKRASNCSSVSIHKEWRNLTSAEQSTYLDAELCLMSLEGQTGFPNVTNRFLDLDALHQNLTDIIHNVVSTEKEISVMKVSSSRITRLNSILGIDTFYSHMKHCSVPNVATRELCRKYKTFNWLMKHIDLFPDGGMSVLMQEHSLTLPYSLP